MHERVSSPPDIDECALDAGLCAPHGSCTNLEGSFTCSCPPGYSPAPPGQRGCLGAGGEGSGGGFRGSLGGRFGVPEACLKVGGVPGGVKGVPERFWGSLGGF